MSGHSIFVSYSHKDERWKNRLVTHLGVLEQEGILDLWEDRRIEVGDDWKPEIEKAIDKATVAILLVSADFLTSKFILDEEIPKLLERREKEGVRIIPIIVKPCAWTQVKWLSKIQARPKDGKPLSGGTPYQIDMNLAEIAAEIARILSAPRDIHRGGEESHVSDAKPASHKTIATQHQAQIDEHLTTTRSIITYDVTFLDLSGNRLSTFRESISQFPNLTELHLNDNQLSILPEWITQLQNLRTLDLSNNQLSMLPEWITQLQNLRTLDLSNNQFSTLPETITRLQNLSDLVVNNNPLISPPIEIATQGVGAVREYFRQLHEEGVDYLYEAKLLILGEGGVGKTTLAKKILNSSYVLKEEDSTRGVDILKWSFPIEGKKQLKVNIWDFGGQEIYHATYQFFLTPRSLYVLVVDRRKEVTDLHFWLHIVEMLGDGSPLLIVKNEKQDRHLEINERALKEQFDSLKEVLPTNLATNRGLQDIKEEIEYYIKKLPRIGTPLPRTWVRVREQLEKDPRNHISLEEYLAICRTNGFTVTKDSLQLSGYLHDIGVLLHFRDDPLLRRAIILKPNWAAQAVYKVLDNTRVVRNQGRFTREDLDRIWAAPEYENMRDELLQLMINFKLCYEIPTPKGGYIAPQLLTINQPEYEWDNQDNLLLRYSYAEFMPKRILTQFIVAMYPYIWEQTNVWKSGIVIEKDRTRAEVVEPYGKLEIRVRVAGVQKRDLMTVIRYQLKQIHDKYPWLKYEELIQCNCSHCKDSFEPHFYSVTRLMDLRANGELEIECSKSHEKVNVSGLLGDVSDMNRFSKRSDFLPQMYVIGDYYQGKVDDKIIEINQNIKGSTIHGKVVAAETIKGSFNTIQKSNASDELKDNLSKLTQAVEVMAEELPKEKAEEAADDMKRLVEEATREKPNPKFYNVSIQGLIAAAQNLGKVGDEVIKLTEKVRKILTGGDMVTRPEKAKRNGLFISYSHQDKDWLTKVQPHIEVLEKMGIAVNLWDDTQIKAGMRWKEEIEKALASAKVAVLLVSTDFLNSDFISRDEVPALLKAAQEDGATILPLILKPCLYTSYPDLKEYQAVNDPSKPLSTLRKSEQDKILVALSQRIIELMKQSG